MKYLSLLLLFACAEAPPSADDTGLDWSGASAEAPARTAFQLSVGLDGNEVGRGADAELCPADAEYVGGSGHAVVCLDDEASVVVALSRGVDGATAALDGVDAVCPAEWETLGLLGERVVCRREGPGRAAAITRPVEGAEPGPPAPLCPTDWEAVGFADQQAVCVADGLGATFRLTRDAAGVQLTDADPAQVCPEGSATIGLSAWEAVCDWPGAATSIELSRVPSDPVAVGEVSCPVGWERLGGWRERAVCGLPASVSALVLAHDAAGVGWPALEDQPQPCPAGFVWVGGLGQALVCVERPAGVSPPR